MLSMTLGLPAGLWVVSGGASIAVPVVGLDVVPEVCPVR